MFGVYGKGGGRSGGHRSRLPSTREVVMGYPHSHSEALCCGWVVSFPQWGERVCGTHLGDRLPTLHFLRRRSVVVHAPRSSSVPCGDWMVMAVVTRPR